MNNPKLSVAERFLSKVAIDQNGCHIWTASRNREGYGSFKVGGTTRLAHRVAWQLANGWIIPTGLLVCHRCDTPSCVNPDHLFLGTNDENIKDRDRKGRTWSKLTSADVLAIQQAGGTQRELARAFGVSQPTICRIKYGAFSSVASVESELKSSPSDAGQAGQ